MVIGMLERGGETPGNHVLLDLTVLLNDFHAPDHRDDLLPHAEEDFPHPAAEMPHDSLLNPLPEATRDTLTASLRRIETLAALLEELVARKPGEPVDAVVLAEAAGMIGDETARMRAALCLSLDANPRTEQLPPAFRVACAARVLVAA